MIKNRKQVSFDENTKNDDDKKLTLEEAINNPQCEMDRYFLTWLKTNNVGLVVASYKTQRVMSFGEFYDKKDKRQKLSIWLTTFMRPMGITPTNDGKLWITSSGNLWLYDNDGEFDHQQLGHFDANYIPRMAYYGSDIDVHDVCACDDKVYYCSALFSCICEPSTSHTFKVYWKPPWISKIAAEDRCHLNGLCARDGVPRYVTSASIYDDKGLWRNHREGNGIVYDIVNNETVCEGLTMPHSPRWHAGRLWILEAGTGWFGYVNLAKKKFVKKVWIPGYLRGLSFVGNRYAVIGSSLDRHEKTFADLPLGKLMDKKGILPECGVHVIDLRNWDKVHYLTFYSPIDELYDVCVIPNTARPKVCEVMEDHNLLSYKIDTSALNKETINDNDNDDNDNDDNDNESEPEKDSKKLLKSDPDFAPDADSDDEIVL